jgi:hypothetical protein
MTTLTEVPLVNVFHVVEASEFVKCNFFSCNNKELGNSFAPEFFNPDLSWNDDKGWSRYLDSVCDARVFTSEESAKLFKDELGLVASRIHQLDNGLFQVNVWSRIVQVFCPSHSSNCASCSELISVNFSTDIDGDSYCDDCRDNNFYYCDNCSEWSVSVSELDGDSYCSPCIDSVGASWCDYCDMYERDLCDSNFDPDDVDIWSSRNYEGIMNYSFKPSRPDFFMGSADVDDSRLFYGMELEVESMDNSMTDGMNIIKDSLAELVYFKADGSLDRGYELVTYPFTFNYYSEAIDFKFLSGLQELGYRSWSAGTCGLHLHVSRTGFGSSGHIWKFAQLILSNQFAWSKLAGRNSSRWASFDPETNSVMKVLKGEKFPERYCAVNLSNADTIEVRIFRGSLNERRVRSAIESVDCAIQYTRNLSVHEINNGALKFGRFADWVNENRTDCASFIDLMCEYGLIPSLKIAEPEVLLLGEESLSEAVGLTDSQGSLSVLSANVDSEIDLREYASQSSNRTNLENGDN